MPACPLCSGTRFVDFRNRVGAKCARCGSLERTRLLYALIARLVPEPGRSVLHIAPERALAAKLFAQHGNSYLASDLSLENLEKALPPEAPRIQIDLCDFRDQLNGKSFDLIVHSHVMEHLPCNWALPFLQLNALIRPGGFHVFAVPVTANYCIEDLNAEMSPDERIRLFGQKDHLRRFGRVTFAKDLATIQSLTKARRLSRAEEFFSEEEMANMRARDTVFALQTAWDRRRHLLRWLTPR